MSTVSDMRNACIAAINQAWESKRQRIEDIRRVAHMGPEPTAEDFRLMRSCVILVYGQLVLNLGKQSA